MKTLLPKIRCFFMGHLFEPMIRHNGFCPQKRVCSRCRRRQVFISAYDMHGWYDDKD